MVLGKLKAERFTKRGHYRRSRLGVESRKDLG